MTSPCSSSHHSSASNFQPAGAVFELIKLFSECSLIITPRGPFAQDGQGAWNSRSYANERATNNCPHALNDGSRHAKGNGESAYKATLMCKHCHGPGSFRQIPHFEAPVPWFMEADSMPGSAATYWFDTERNFAAPSGNNATVVTSESSPIVLDVRMSHSKTQNAHVVPSL